MSMAEAEREKAETGKAASSSRKRLVVQLVLLVSGILTGMVSAAAYFILTGAYPVPSVASAPAPEEEKLPPEFVPLNRLTVPLVTPEGGLSGYVNLDLKLEVQGGEEEFVKARLPLVRHAINQTLSQTSVANPSNPLLLDFDVAERVLRDTANESLGKPVILSAKITTVLPL